MDNIDKSNRIEHYLTDQMTPEENEAFMNDLKNDKDLREEAQMMALLIKDMKEELAKQDNEVIEEVLAAKKKAKIVQMTRWAFSIAAMFVLIFGITHIYRMNRIDNLFNDYYSSYPMSSARGGDDEVIKEGLAILYNKVGTDKDITPVISRLQTIYDNIQSNNKDYADYTFYENDIAWYLALAYLKQHNIDKAKQLLLSLSETGDTQSEILLNDLNK